MSTQDQRLMLRVARSICIDPEVLSRSEFNEWAIALASMPLEEIIAFFKKEVEIVQSGKSFILENIKENSVYATVVTRDSKKTLCLFLGREVKEYAVEVPHQQVLVEDFKRCKQEKSIPETNWKSGRPFAIDDYFETVLNSILHKIHTYSARIKYLQLCDRDLLLWVDPTKKLVHELLEEYNAEFKALEKEIKNYRNNSGDPEYFMKRKMVRKLICKKITQHLQKLLVEIGA